MEPQSTLSTISMIARMLRAVFFPNYLYFFLSEFSVQFCSPVFNWVVQFVQFFVYSRQQSAGRRVAGRDVSSFCGLTFHAADYILFCTQKLFIFMESYLSVVSCVCCSTGGDLLRKSLPEPAVEGSSLITLYHFQGARSCVEVLDPFRVYTVLQVKRPWLRDSQASGQNLLQQVFFFFLINCLLDIHVYIHEYKLRLILALFSEGFI